MVAQDRDERAGVVETEVARGIHLLAHHDPPGREDLVEARKVQVLVIDEDTVEVEERRFGHETMNRRYTIARLHRLGGFDDGPSEHGDGSRERLTDAFRGFYARSR